MDGKVLKVTIVDTGIGMDKKALAGLFTPFYQGDLSTTRKYGGTGLGLHISKNLVERLGGSISVYSKPQQGSKFSICLPCELTDETRWLEDYEVAVTSAPSNDETNQLVALQGNILLAEDHPDNQL